MTSRRAIVAAIFRFGAALAVAKAVPASAQSPGRPPRVSYFNPASPEVPGHAAFRKAMGDLGFIEGRTIRYEDRFAEGRIERLPILAAELAALNVDVIVAVSTAAIEAARAGARRPEEFTEAFAAMRSERAQGLIVSANTQFFMYRKGIIDLAAESRLPAVCNFRENAENGGLLAYGPSLDELARRAASFVARILKGARPATLPIEQPATFDLVVNLKTARSLGITIPQAVLGRATHVIE